jgi:hypothetical protein
VRGLIRPHNESGEQEVEREVDRPRAIDTGGKRLDQQKIQFDEQRHCGHGCPQASAIPKKNRRTQVDAAERGVDPASAPGPEDAGHQQEDTQREEHVGG